MLSKFMNNMKDLCRESYINFPLTNICIFIITVCLMIDFDSNIMNDILTLVGLFLLGCYCIETKKINKLYYILAFFISFLFWLVLRQEYDLWIFEFVSKLSLTYILIISIFSIYNSYKNSGKTFPEYLENVYRGSMKLSFVYSVLALSIYIIISIFNSLVIDIINEDIITDVEIFLCGMYYVSNMLYIFKGINNNEGTFFKFLVRNILNPLLYVAVIIIYLFIIRLFIDGEIDEDYVFYIVSYLFLLGVPLILMCSSYKENNILDKINNYSSYIFIPLILLQFYLLFNKINSYGILEDGYIWIMIIIFEIFYLYYSIRKIDYGNLFIVLMIMIVISILVPFVNIEDLVLYSQYMNLEVYKNKSNYTEIEKTRIYNAYDYLYYSSEGKEYFNKLGLTDEDINIIKKFDKDYNEYEDYNEYDSMYAYDNAKIIDVSGYDRFSEFSVSEYGISISYIDRLKIRYDGEIIEFNFYDMYMNYYKNKNVLNKYFIENNIILLDDKYKLVLTSIDISYKNDMISRYNINGYLLVKEDNEIVGDNVIIE